MGRTRATVAQKQAARTGALLMPHVPLLQSPHAEAAEQLPSWICDCPAPVPPRYRARRMQVLLAVTHTDSWIEVIMALVSELTNRGPVERAS